MLYSTDQGFATSDSVAPLAAAIVGGGVMFALIGLPFFSQRRHRSMLLMSLLGMAAWLVVSCGGNGGGTITPVAPAGGTEQATATGLTAGTTYYWKVVASDD